ncbi:phytase [uncultured Pseudoteredinibacter sp.]|uniref:phytase n=1 Tax=uncultured Pseudoteredinibacter sp. TaxID=1641701 RepID=UPI0026373A48|nr:phytase [uncultured Pseudoteredinibacter sp.]
MHKLMMYKNSFNKTLASTIALFGLIACAEHSEPRKSNIKQENTEVAASYTVESAQQIIPLDNYTIAISESFGLRLLDKSGSTLQEIQGKFELADFRKPGGFLRLLIVDKNKNTPILFTQVDEEIRELNRFASPGFNIDGLCLNEFEQQLFAFYLDGEGRAQQWLINDRGPSQQVRKFTTAPGSYCAVDDSEQVLYVSEESTGVWAYEAEPEAESGRELIALTSAWDGILGTDISAISAIDGGFAALSTIEGSVTLVIDGEFKARYQLAGAAEAEQLALAQDEEQLKLASVDEQGQVYLWHDNIELKNHSAANMPQLKADGETQAMPRYGDVADDPAIWVNQSSPTDSLILGTNKTAGLHSYSLDGKEQQFLRTGRLNNVDIVYQVPLNDGKSDIAAASLRDNNSIAMFQISSDGVVREAGQIATSMHEIYGLCMFQTDGKAYVLANDKSGLYQQYLIGGSSRNMTGQLSREFSLPGQPEGCAVDEKQQRLFMGEEDVGIWVIDSKPESQSQAELIHKVGGPLKDDVEGMAIYQGKDRDYLVVSSQGNNSYAVYDTLAPFEYRGSFKISMDPLAGLDGASETDGLHVTSANLGGKFSEGLLVVQDGHNVLPSEPQNFKLLSWSAIREALKLQ